MTCFTQDGENKLSEIEKYSCDIFQILVDCLEIVQELFSIFATTFHHHLTIRQLIHCATLLLNYPNPILQYICLLAMSHDDISSDERRKESEIAAK